MSKKLEYYTKYRILTFITVMDNNTGIFLMALWNNYAVKRLLKCKELLDSVASGADDVDPTDIYAFIALKACGKVGNILVKSCVGITLIGVCVAYLIAATDLIQATWLSVLYHDAPILTRFLNTMLCLIVVVPLSLAPSLALLSYSSLVGLIALGVSFAVIIGIGYSSPSLFPPAVQSIMEQAFSTSAQGLSRFFGVACFCFGVPPLVFPIQGTLMCGYHYIQNH